MKEKEEIFNNLKRGIILLNKSDLNNHSLRYEIIFKDNFMIKIKPNRLANPYMPKALMTIRKEEISEFMEKYIILNEREVMFLLTEEIHNHDFHVVKRKRLFKKLEKAKRFLKYWVKDRMFACYGNCNWILEDYYKEKEENQSEINDLDIYYEIWLKGKEEIEKLYNKNIELELSNKRYVFYCVDWHTYQITGLKVC